MSEPATTATPDYLSTVNIGQVVSASVAGGQVFAVVAGLIEDYPQMPPGRWLGVASDGQVDWIRPQDVINPAPTCLLCGQSQWWWDPQAHVSCVRCYPPNPDWSMAFKELSDLMTLEFPPGDPRRLAVEAAVQNCDRAWINNNWPNFQASATKVEWLVKVQWLVMSGLLPTPGGLNE